MIWGVVKKVQHTNQWENMTQCKQPMRKHDTKWIENVENLKRNEHRNPWDDTGVVLKQQIWWHHNTRDVNNQWENTTKMYSVEMLQILTIMNIKIWEMTLVSCANNQWCDTTQGTGYIQPMRQHDTLVRNVLHKWGKRRREQDLKGTVAWDGFLS